MFVTFMALVIGRPVTDLLAPLSHNQLSLLTTMADPYIQTGEWPTWYFVRETLSRVEGLDADEQIQSLHTVGLSPGQGMSYGLTWSNHPHLIQDNARPGLTVAAAFHVPSLLPVMANPFLNVLREVVKIYQAVPLEPDRAAPATYSAEMIKRALPSISDLFMARLTDILDHEPATRAGARRGGDVEWTREMGRDVARYGGIDGVKSYVERVTELMPKPRVVSVEAARSRSVTGRPPATLEDLHRLVTNSSPVPKAQPVSDPQPKTPVYVKEALINELEDKNAHSQWDVTKLVQLTRELNSNFTLDNPYACHALIRAILDHTAPVFGRKTFEQVASNPPATWTKTDKDYLRKLLDFKPQGHDALHRHIRKSADLIDMHDVPSGAWLNAFLRLVIDAL
ncbi:hypothetical protein ACIRBZ_42765 [Streptomyces sp. NPDC094038]|uniref:hypothetical protein n=1 Tax=Streptomyces sp. NPDC094038 TaxID=3366055 RepID=UPI0038208036